MGITIHVWFSCSSKCSDGPCCLLFCCCQYMVLTAAQPCRYPGSELIRCCVPVKFDVLKLEPLNVERCFKESIRVCYLPVNEGTLYAVRKVCQCSVFAVCCSCWVSCWSQQGVCSKPSAKVCLIRKAINAKSGCVISGWWFRQGVGTCSPRMMVHRVKAVAANPASTYSPGILGIFLPLLFLGACWPDIVAYP